MKDTLFKGTKVKYRIEIESPGFDMHDDDFTIKLTRGTYSHTYAKTDLIEKLVDGKYEYYLCFDTDTYGVGDIIAEIKAYVPDTDFTGDVRLEIDRFRLVNVQPL